MALAKNSVVIPRAALNSALIGEEAFGFGGGGIPILGLVESISPAVVCWMNGTKVTYQTNTELLELAAPAGTALYHHRVRVTGLSEDPANPNSQGASEGLVIGGFTLVSGSVDFLVIQFSANDIAIFAASACTVID
jgi:hypothetical protein